jgi:hypothetical protein
MVSKRKAIEKTKPPKIELIDKKEKIMGEQKKQSRTLIWIIVILIIASVLELILLVMK